MRKAAIFSIVSLVLLGLVSMAFAQEFRARIGEQQKRIDQGIASGQLTRQEADILQDNLNWIKYEFSRMTDDGLLTQAESMRLDDMLDRNSRMIADKKLNPVTAFYVKKVSPGEFLIDRIQNQQKRINQGIKQGQLTRHEADILNDNLNRIRDAFHDAKRSGRLDWRELDRLDRMLDRNSMMIYNKKHNRDAKIEPIDFNLFIRIN